MQKRVIILIILGFVLLVVMALCGLTIYATYISLKDYNGTFYIIDNGNVSAQVEETLVFDFKPGDKLVVHSAGGGIRVEPGEEDEIRVEMIKTAWREDEESAAVAAEAMNLLATETEEGLVLTYKKSDTGEFNFTIDMSDTIEMLILVPEQTVLDLDTDFGDISVDDLQGDADLENDSGKIEVQNLEGALTLVSLNGDLVLKNINAGGGDISAKSDFGGLRAEGLSAENISLSSLNGDITGHDLDAKKDLLLETDFGGINMENLESGSLSVESENGVVNLEDGYIDGDLLAKSEFGAVTVQNVEATAYDLYSQVGDLVLDGCRGKLDLYSDFGRIEVFNAQESVLNLSSTNGQIHFEGSLDESSEHVVENQFGDIELVIPAKSAFDVEISTEFGTITSDIPVTLIGEINEGKWSGTLNGGGNELTVMTDNGNITISILKTENSSGE